MTTIGEVNKIPIKANVLSICNMSEIEWKIPNFFSLLDGGADCYRSVSYYCRSPSFSFLDKTWYLEIYPNGRASKDSKGCIGLYLMPLFSFSSIRLDYTLGLKTFDGKKDSEHHRTCTFSNEGSGYGVHACIAIYELRERKYDLMQNDVLTIFCNLKDRDAVENSNKITTGNCAQTYAGKPMEERKRKAESENISDDETLCQVYKKVLLEGRHHDLTLKVGDKQLRAHRDILRARSRVFQSMLDHDMKEKKNREIDIPDCSPKSVELFLTYIYCGQIEALDKANMLELYYIADKYEVIGLRNDCTNFIKNSLSIDNICSVIQLASNHTDSDLLDKATEYFTDNILDIMQTVEWQLFFVANSTIANEFMFKAVEKIKK